MTRRKHFLLILLLGSLTTLSPFSIDMYLPGFPAIANDLNTTVAKVSLSLSSFFVGISAGQLLYGPLLDRYGRKWPLYFGLVVYILASAGCIVSMSIESLIVLRLVQAIGSCAAGVAAIAMVRDLFPVEDSAKVFALLMLVIGVSPMLAPTIGGYVISAFGWHAVFIVLGILGLLLLVAVRLWLPESYKPDTSISLKPRPIITTFLKVAREPQFYTYALSGAIAFSGLFAYVAGSPLLFMDIFKVDGKTYGWIFAFLSIGFIGSSQINSLLLRKYKSEQMVYAAMIGQSVTGLLFLLGMAFEWYGLGETITFLFLFLSCIGITNPNAAALSMAPFSKNAGSASALMGALQMGIGSLASLAIGLLDNGSAVPMVGVMAGSSVLALFTLLVGRKNILQKTEVQSDTNRMIIH